MVRYTLSGLLPKLEELAVTYNFNLQSVFFRFEQDCLVVEGIDKTHELVIYSDLTHELKSI